MPEKNSFPAVLQPVVIDRAAFNQGANAQYEPHIEQTDVMDSLVARGPHAVGVSAITFQPGNLRREAGADPSTVATTTLKASMGDQMPHVAYPAVPLDGMNLLSRLGPCGENHSIQNFTPGDPMFTLKKGGDQHGVLTPMAVRRLTPVECERLQGFPDNWSQIPWKGKPADQCPDGPRYKCAGNSMAVPVMRWIGEQIARVELSTQQPK
jgi:DNA (cytosine-5)-methyltransferase 1